MRDAASRRGVLTGLAAAALVRPAKADWTPVPPRPAPFSVQRRDGTAVTPADHAGAGVLLHFWASWCVSCRDEFPALEALQREMGGQGLVVLAVSLDRLGWPVIDQIARSLGLRHVTLLHDLNRDSARALGIVALPTTLVLDRSGREVARHRGTVDWSQTEVRARLHRVLAGAPFTSEERHS